MRVTYLCADAGIPVYGSKGCSIHVQEIVRAFLKRGDDVSLYALRSGGIAPRDWSRCQLFERALGNSEGISDRERLQRLGAEQIAESIEFDKTDLLYERYSLWSDQSLIAAKRHDIPSILEVNAPLIEEQIHHRELIQRMEAESIRNSSFLAARTIIAVSEQVARYVRQHLPKSHHSKVHIVPNGVDIDRFFPHDPPRKDSLPLTIGFLGTLKPWHGLESLLDAFPLVHAAFPNARLRIVGDGPQRQRLQDRIQHDYPEIGLNVDWIGAVPSEQVPIHLRNFDIAVAPYMQTSDFYFSPLKVYEYMASGCAVVASDLGQLRELIIDRENGSLYPAGDVSSLSCRILELAFDRELRQRLGHKARQAMISSHSWDRTLERILRHSREDSQTMGLRNSGDHRSSL